MKKKKTKNNKRKKKRNIDLGFGDFSAFLPGASKQNTEDNFEILRQSRVKVTSPSKVPNNVFYNINSAGVVQDTRDFVYQDRKIVPRGTPYHIHIDPDTKKETYMTEATHQPETEQIFRVRGATVLGQYVRLRGNNAEQTYLSEYEWKPEKKDIKRGFSIRYFVKQSFGEGKIFEIKPLDADKSGRLYTKVNVDWAVGYNKNRVFEKNVQNLEYLEESGYGVLLNELEAYDGYLGVEDHLTEKLIDLNEKINSTKAPEGSLLDLIGKGKKKKKKGSKGKKKKKGGSKGSGAGSSGGGSNGGGGAY